MSDTTKTIKLVEVANPFQPMNREIWDVEVVGSESVANLLGERKFDEFVIAINGKVVDQPSDTYVVPGDSVTLVKVLTGGGDTKDILRIAAMIAIAVAAPYAAAALGGGGLLQAGIVIAGNLLVNAILPPTRKQRDSSSSAEARTYGIDSAKNTAQEGIPVPVVYGTTRFAGNVINEYVVNDGETQFLHMLINCGEGPVASISDVHINEQPITNYSDVWIETRLGEPEQSPISWFVKSIVPHSVSVETSTSWFTYTTTDVVDQLRVDFAAPSGLFVSDDNGNFHDITVGIEVQYKRHDEDASQWRQLPCYDKVMIYHNEYEYFTFAQIYGDVYGDGDNDGTAAKQVYVPDGSETIIQDRIYKITNNGWRSTALLVGHVKTIGISGTSYDITANSRQAVRRSFTSEPLATAIYDVRARRKAAKSTDVKYSDVVYLTDINEILSDQVAYRNTALLGIRIKLSEQLNGIPSVTHVNGGKIIRVWDNVGKRWVLNSSSSPAWITLDMMTNKRYGAGEPMSRFNIERWKDWANWCEDNHLEFNGAFTSTTNVWDAASQVFRCGHAQRIDVGTRYSVAIERPEPPVQMFSVANMVSGSFKETWLPMAERSNEIEASYLDRDDNYKQKNIKVIDKFAQIAGKKPRSSKVDLFGVTSSDQAWKDINILLNYNRLIKRVVSFSSPIEAIAATVGDVVLVQHDMPKWGYGGRLEAGSTVTTIKLDRPVTMEPSKLYSFTLHIDAIRRFNGTIKSISGNGLTLSGYNGSTDVKRLKINGLDLEVTSIYANGSDFAITVDDVSGISAGNVYELWDTNAIFSTAVINFAGIESVTTDVLTLASPCPVAPKQFTKWLFGENTLVAKPFRVKAITGSHEYRRDITAIEYNEDSYVATEPRPVINYSALTSAVQQAIIEGSDEQTQTGGGITKSTVTIHYGSDQPTYVRSTVLMSRNGGAERVIGSDPRSVSVEALTGEILTFRVVAMDVAGRSAPVSGAPTFTWTVEGKTTRPGAVTGLSYNFTDTGIVFKWNKPLEKDWQTTRARLGASWAASGAELFDGKLTEFTWPFQSAGTQQVTFRNFIPDVASFDSVVSVTVLNPVKPTINNVEVNLGSASVHWGDAKTSQPIKTYVLKLSDQTVTDVALATDFTKVSGSTYSAVVVNPTAGDKRVWIQAIDVAGNVGPWDHYDFSVSSAQELNVMTLSATSQVFKVDKDGNPAIASITLNANLSAGLSGNATFTTTPNVTLGGVTPNVRTLSFANMGANESVTITAQLVNAGTTYTDYITIVKVKDGVSGVKGDKGDAGESTVTAILSNEFHSLAVDDTNAVITYAGATSTMQVFVGATDDSANWTFTKVNSANVDSTITGNTVTIGNLSAASGYVDITASKAGKSPVTKRFSIGKQSIGSPAVNATLSAENIAVPSDADGVVVGLSSPTVTMTVRKAGIDDSANWAFTATKSGNCTYSIAGNVVTITGLTDAIAWINITAKKAGNSDITKTVLLYKAKQGIPGVDSLSATLSNEAMAIGADSAGNVVTFVGAASTMRVYKGTTEVTNLYSFSRADGAGATSALTVDGSGLPTITLNNLGPAIDSSYIDVTATEVAAPHASIMKRIKITKLKYGAKGDQGTKGDSGSSGSNAITCVLTNESHSIPCTSGGAPTSYLGSGTDIYVYEGTTAFPYVSTLTANGQFTVSSTVNGIAAGAISASGSGTNRAIVGAHSAMTVEQAFVTYTITVRKLDGSIVSFFKLQTITKAVAGSNGDNGSDATYYYIDATSPVIFKNAPDQFTAGAHTNITVTGKKVQGSTISTFGYLTITANGDAEATTASANTASTSILDSAVKSTYTVKLYNQASVSGATLLDTQVIPVIFKGAKGDAGLKGDSGQRGTVQIGYATAGSSWSDSAAATALSDNGYGVPVLGDLVTLYNSSSVYSESRVYAGSINGWMAISQYLNGNLFVDGTVVASKLAVSSLDSITANLGTVTSGTMTAGTFFGGALSGATGTFSGVLAAGTFNPAAFSEIVNEYTSRGDYTITVPAMPSGWTSMAMKVTIIGGGGSGAALGRFTFTNGMITVPGASGYAGETKVVTYTGVTPGNSYQLHIGKGGDGVNAALNFKSGNQGESSTLTTGLSAAGGSGGILVNSASNADVAQISVAGILKNFYNSSSGQYINGLSMNAAIPGQASTMAAGSTYPANGYEGSGGGGLNVASASKYSGAGGDGYAKIEFFDPNFVVTGNRYSNLISWLDTKLGAVPTNAR